MTGARGAAEEHQASHDAAAAEDPRRCGANVLRIRRRGAHPGCHAGSAGSQHRGLPCENEAGSPSPVRADDADAGQGQGRGGGWAESLLAQGFVCVCVCVLVYDVTILQLCCGAARRYSSSTSACCVTAAAQVCRQSSTAQMVLGTP